MTGALTAIDAKDFTRHEAGRLEAENRVDDVGDLTHMADRMQGAELQSGPPWSAQNAVPLLIRAMKAMPRRGPQSAFPISA